jgi:protein-disulfide isomerase
MRARRLDRLGILALVALCACGEEAAETADTSATTENLLASMPAGGDMSELPTGALAPGRPVAPQQQAPERPPIDVALLGYNSGVGDAPVRVVEMSDYGCGYCRKFHLETWPVLRDEFVDAGKVEWKFLPFVSGMFANSPIATEAAECVLEQGQDLFLVMNERLWTDQSEWKGASDAHGVVRGMADDAGADMSAWDGCMTEDRRNERVLAATALGRQLGVRGTPTFFVVGYPPLQGALETDVFREVLGLVYEEATKDQPDD